MAAPSNSEAEHTIAALHYGYRVENNGQLKAVHIIPPSSLRAFIEALTAGWVSQANTEYKKGFRERHNGTN